MINLEWLRTFRTVYRTKSLSKAAQLLSLSQPTVSQQIAALEAHLGQKLFTRKSKGVLETDEGKLLNTMVAGSIESLEMVETQVSKKNSGLKNILTIGISPHLYKTTLCQQILDLGPYVHIKFGAKDSLIRDVEEGTITYAVVPDTHVKFDLLCYPLYVQHLQLVASKDLDLNKLKHDFTQNLQEAENWLNKQVWYAHDASSSYIKVFWLHAFNKKRPNIVPNYVVPNEFEILFQLSQSSGVSFALDSVAEFFIKENSLQSIDLVPIAFRELSLIANKRQAKKEITDQLLTRLLAKKKEKD